MFWQNMSFISFVFSIFSCFLTPRDPPNPPYYLRRHAQYGLFTFLQVSSTFSSSGHALPTWSFDFPPHPRSNTHARTPREQRFKADDATQQRQRRNEATTATQRHEDDDATQQRQRRQETQTTTQRSKENDATKHRQPQH